MTILQRYIARQVTIVFLATYSILALILLAQLLSRVFSRVIEGQLTADVIGVVMVLGLIKSSTLLVPFGLMLSIVMVVGRLQQESELVSMRAAGLDSYRLLSCLAWVVFPLALILMLSISYITPWANRLAELIEVVSEQTIGFQTVVPGQFFEIEDQNAVIYARDSEVATGALIDVFVHKQSGNEVDIEVARKLFARMDDNGEVSFVLDDGYHYRGAPGQSNFSVSRYLQHILVLPGPDFGDKADRSEYQNIFALWSTTRPDYTAEIYRRASVLISVFTLALLGAGFAVVRQRFNRYSSFALATLSFFIYFNLILVSTKFIKHEAAWAIILLLMTHLFMLVLGVWLYRKNMAVSG